MDHWSEDSTDTVLIGTPNVRVRGYEWSGEHFGAPRAARSPWHSVLFVRSGLFEKRLAGRPLVADPNWAIFFNDAEEYAIHAPSPFSDAVTELQVRPAVLAEMVIACGGRASDPLARPFDHPRGLIGSRLFRRHLRLWADARRGDACDPLDVEERALVIVGAAIRIAMSQAGSRPRRRRPDTLAAHADLAYRTMHLLGRRFDERWTIHTIARQVAASPYHLCRVFRAETGVSIHRYLERLRLRAALARLLDRPASLTSLALELGFSSHSHFASSFRREYSVTPSSVRAR